MYSQNRTVSSSLLPPPISSRRDYPFDPPKRPSRLQTSSNLVNSTLLLLPDIDPPDSPTFLPHHEYPLSATYRPIKVVRPNFRQSSASASRQISATHSIRLSAISNSAVADFFDKPPPPPPPPSSAPSNPDPGSRRYNSPPTAVSSPPPQNCTHTALTRRSSSFAVSPLALLSALSIPPVDTRTGFPCVPYSSHNPWLLPGVNNAPLLARLGISSFVSPSWLTALSPLKLLVQKRALATVSTTTDEIWRSHLLPNFHLFSRFAYSFRRVLMSLVSSFTFWLPPSPDLDPPPQQTGQHGQLTRPFVSDLVDDQDSSFSRLNRLSAQLRPLLLPATIPHQFERITSPHAPHSQLYFHLNPPPLVVSIPGSGSVSDSKIQHTIKPRFLSIQSPLDSVFSTSPGISAPPGFAVLDISSDSDSELEQEVDSSFRFPDRPTTSFPPHPISTIFQSHASTFDTPITPVLQVHGHHNSCTPFPQLGTRARPTSISHSVRKRISGHFPLPVAISTSSPHSVGTATTGRHRTPGPPSSSSHSMSQRRRPATMYFQPTPTPIERSEFMSRRDTSASISSDGTCASFGTRPSSSCATSVGQVESFQIHNSKSSRSSNRMSMPIPPSPMSHPHHSQSPSVGPPSTSFLTLLAAQERKVMELREQLEQAETHLATLKSTWTNEAVKQKRFEKSKPQNRFPTKPLSTPTSSSIEVAAATQIRNIHRPAPSVSGLYDVAVDTPQERLNRRHSMMSSSHRPYQRKVMSGLLPRPLSLLTESPIPIGRFEIPDTPIDKSHRSEEEERMDALAALEGRSPTNTSGLNQSYDNAALQSPSVLAASTNNKGFSSAFAPQQRLETGIRRRPSSISSNHPDHPSLSPTTTSQDPLLGESTLQNRPRNESSASEPSAMLMTTARGVRDSLWTLFEDIKQVVSNDMPRPPESAPPPSASSRASSRTRSVYLPSHAHSFSLPSAHRPRRSVDKTNSDVAPTHTNITSSNRPDRNSLASSTLPPVANTRQRMQHRPTPSLPLPPLMTTSASSNNVTASSFLIPNTANNRRRSVFPPPSSLISPTVSSKVYEETSGDINEWETWGVSQTPPENAPIMRHSAKQNDYGSLFGLTGDGYNTENSTRGKQNALGVLFEEDWR